MIERIMQMRATLISESDTNSSGGPRCGAIAEWIAVEFNVDMMYGTITDNNGREIDTDHAWAILGDGTIIDASIDQFSDHFAHTWPGTSTIAIVPPSHPFYSHYEKPY